MKKIIDIERLKRLASTILTIVAIFNIFGSNIAYSDDIVSKDRILIHLSDTIGKINLSLVDSTATVSIDSDSLAADSSMMQLPDSTLKDSINIFDKSEVIGGVMPIIEEKLLESNFVTKQDSIKKKEIEVRRPFSQLALERSPIFKKDTLSIKQVTLFSLAAPGFGQLYNKEYYKIPIIYGVMGGFVTGGVLTSKKYNDAKLKYESVVGTEISASELASYRGEMDRYKTQKTLMVAGTALTYVYSLADGIINYKGEIHPTRKATILSAIFPGAGQLYNKKYWKLPIIYGGLATFGYIIDFNNRGYQRYKLAYNLLTDGDDNTVDEFDGYYPASTLQNTRNSYRRYRDLGILMTAGFYLLQVIDAHVDAYLSRYDISNDLAMSIEPTIIENNQPFKSSSNGYNKGFGMGLRFDF